MAYGIARGPPVDDADLTAFISTISSLPTEEWRSRISALKSLVDSIPDYSTTPFDESTGEYVNNNNADSDVLDPSTTPSSSSSRRGGGGSNGNGGGNGNGNGNGNGAKSILWYRSYKSVRHLARPLATLLLDARSAVVKDATELVGTLLAVKLQPHPSLTRDDDVVVVDKKEQEGGEGNHDENGEDDTSNANNGGLETINGKSLLFDGGASKKEKQQRQNHARPPPAFVGRLLLKDLLPSILDLSRQTVKTIRTYGVNMMTVDVLPHCRVKSCIVLLLERMKVHVNRTVREDSARYLRCVLETWPSWDDNDNDNDNGDNGNGVSNANDGIGIVNSRKEERLSLDSARQIGLGLGRTLSDSAKPVREEAKRGFEALFRRFRKVWDEVMSSGVVRDVRLRKKLLEAAGGSSNIFDDATSLGEMSLNSAVSGMSFASNRSHMSHRSYASRGMANNNGGGGNGGISVPSMIGTPKTSPGGGGGRSRHGYSPSSSSPGYMRGTGASAVRTALTLMGDVDGIAVREPSAKYSTKNYVTSSGHVISTPSPSSLRRRAPSSSSYGGGGGVGRTPQQPFASLLQTPARHEDHHRGHHHRSTVAPIAMTELSSDRGRSCNEDPSSRGEDLKRRLSRRISGIPGAGGSAEAEAASSAARDRCRSPSHLTSIDEAEDGNDIGSATAAAPAVAGEEEGVAQSSEIANVAMEVIAAHLSHLEHAGALIAKEREMLSDLAKRLGVPPGSITDGTNAAGLASRIAVAMSEGDVCDYFESVHACADEQREACESLLGEMERISEGGGGGRAGNASAGVGSPAMGSHPGREPAQSPLASTQRDLEGQFIASS